MTTKKTVPSGPDRSPSQPSKTSRTTVVDHKQSNQVNNSNRVGLSFSVKPAQPTTTGSGSRPKK